VPAKKKILVVEDDSDMRIFISTILKTGGFKPMVAKNGKDGMNKAEKENPACIIMDVPMSENTGMLMYQHLKQDRKLQYIPVIMISAIDKLTFIHYQKTKGIRLGQDIISPEGFLEKPPEAAELLELIQDILSRGSQKQ